MFSPCLIVPVKPVKRFYYKCDKRFDLEYAVELYEIREYCAIVLISGKATELYLYDGNDIKLVASMNVELPNKFKAGGQSAPRFGRIRDEKIRVYARKICELMMQCYVSEGKFKYKKMVVAGLGEMKNLVSEEPIFVSVFKKYVVQVITIDELCIHKVIKMLSTNNDMEKQEKILKFKNDIGDVDKIDLYVFGVAEVMEMFELGLLKEIFVSDDSEYKKHIQQREKIVVTIVTDKSFVRQYGELVGVKYFVDDTNLVDFTSETKEYHETTNN